MEVFRGTATECALPYGIKQFYLLGCYAIDTSEHTPMQAGTRFTNEYRPRVKVELT